MAIAASSGVDDLAGPHLGIVEPGGCVLSRRGQALEVDGDRANIRVGEVARAVPDHLAHRTKSGRARVMAGLQISSDILERPGAEPAPRRREIRRGPWPDGPLIHGRDLSVDHLIGDLVEVDAAGQRLGAALAAERVAWGMTRAAVAEP